MFLAFNVLRGGLRVDFVAPRIACRCSCTSGFPASFWPAETEAHWQRVVSANICMLLKASSAYFPRGKKLQFFLDRPFRVLFLSILEGLFNPFATTYPCWRTVGIAEGRWPGFSASARVSFTKSTFRLNLRSDALVECFVVQASFASFRAVS